eukprot:scaffold339602_cov32-Prasinocladus_malaysianus.AAC.1
MNCSHSNDSKLRLIYFTLRLGHLHEAAVIERVRSAHICMNTNTNACEYMQASGSGPETP